MISLSRRLGRLAPLALAASLSLSGCDKTTTTTQSANGTVTTTTISPSRAASEAMSEINGSVARAAWAIQSSEAASQALSKAGEAIEDGIITAKVKTALLADPDIKGLHVDVDTRHGVVTLTGDVGKAANLDRAARIARDTSGVKSVDNQLVVKTSS
jgi:hyperosmotically inducible protein